MWLRAVTQTSLMTPARAPGRYSRPGIGLAGDRAQLLVKHHTSVVSGALSTALEKLGKPRYRSHPLVLITASGLQGEQPLVDRRISVTSGKGLALRVGSRSLRFNSLDVSRTASQAPMVPLLQGAKYLGDEQPTQNWYGQGESDCLIKTKQSDGRKPMLTLCDFCPVL
ncbi:unnamed protein product [Bathycoccus prasinos]